MNIPFSSLKPSWHTCKTPRKNPSKCPRLGFSLGEEENYVRGLKGELKERKHERNIQNVRKGRRKTFRFGKAGTAHIHDARWLAALWTSPRAKRAGRRR